MDISSLVIKEVREIPIVIEVIKNQLKNIERLVDNTISEGVDELTYTGCGSSYYAAVRSSYYVLMSSSIRARALPASELLWMLSKKTTHKVSKKVILVFSRSGETAEVKALLNTVKNYYKNNLVIGFTCNPSSFLASNSDYTIVIKECMEESVYMTKSFVALSLLGTLFSIKLLEHLEYESLVNNLEGELEALIQASKTLVVDLDNPRRIANTLTHRSPIAVLGAEDLYPIALEAALKFVEVSYTPAIALHALEFRHGYTGLLENPGFSAILLSSSSQASYEYVERLYNELKSASISVIHISNSGNADYIVDTEDKSYLATLAYIIPLYYIAIFKALNLGYNPDKPKRIVKIVTGF